MLDDWSVHCVQYSMFLLEIWKVSLIHIVMVLVVDEVKRWVWEKPRCDPVKVLLINILVCVIFGFRLRVFEIKSSMNKDQLWWRFRLKATAMPTTFFFIHFHCLHVLAHKKRYIERLFLYLFLFLPLNRYPAPKTFLCIIEHWHQLFATKLQFLVIFSVPKSTVVTQTLVDWNRSHLLFNICSPFTINNNIIIDFERSEKKWNVIRKRKNLPIESNENSFDGCNSPTVTLQ